MKTQLENLLARYSERHPDVTRLKREIETLEAGAPISKFEPREPGSTAVVPTMNPLQQTLIKQINNLNNKINSVQSNNQMLQKKIATYQTRIDNTPSRTIELSKISRTHGVTLRKYQDLLAKSLESQLSENMERKQKAEQFQVVDPANLPKIPERPNRVRILLLGLLGGLAAGFGLVFMWENLNTSFKRGDEVEGYTDIPLLATIPDFTTRRSVLEQRRAQVILVVASGLSDSKDNRRELPRRPGCTLILLRILFTCSSIVPACRLNRFRLRSMIIFSNMVRLIISCVMVLIRSWMPIVTVEFM